MRVVQSSSASVRLDAARAFLLESSPQSEILVVGATRGSADDLVRRMAAGQRATFGCYRFSLTQLAARLASPLLAAGRLAPATLLGVEAVTARAVFDAERDGSLEYLRPVANAPGFPRALARTLEELALAKIPAGRLATDSAIERDLADLMRRVDEQFESAGAVNRARFWQLATTSVTEGDGAFSRCRLLLLDVPVLTATEQDFVQALAARAPAAFATVPSGDTASVRAFASIGDVSVQEPDHTGLDRMRRFLFAPGAAPDERPLADVELFSAPGEGREAVEIARRVLREARSGVPFDRMVIVLRSPQQYAGLLEHAFERAGIPAFFERGTRRPHPAGRAFLALIACAQDNLSARRFAEYLSLGQVPRRTAAQPSNPQTLPSPAFPSAAFPSSQDEIFGALAERAEEITAEETEPTEPAPREFRAPWKWERLLAESRVVSSSDRWERRLRGLRRECELQQRELMRIEPGSARLEHLTRKVEDLNALEAFALPVLRTIADWPVTATWAEWIENFEALAPRVLHRPERVLRVLADLRPMGTVGPVSLDEAARVLARRLATIESDPPARRYGRVFVASPAHLRGRSFDVVFVPALAERLFPQKPREDPLLLDEVRDTLDASLPRQSDRADLEKLQLQLAVGAAERRLYLSFPTVETGEGRPRVPSLYALEVWRAMTGRVPSADELQQTASRASRATLAWPAPAERDEAIDALEHDLATLRGLVDEPDHAARGRAQYMLQLNECLQRSVRERYMRARKPWSRFDGIVENSERIQTLLASHRLGGRVYSLSALQRYAVCPYQFLLGAIYRMRPAEDLEPLQRMDPLTRGSLFHAVQTEFYRQLQTQNALPVTPQNLPEALRVLDRCLSHVETREHDQLAPAIERVWSDEIATIRRDLRLWVDQIAHADDGWLPLRFEWAFGLKDSGAAAEGRDPTSWPDPVRVGGRFLLHGSIDLIEEHQSLTWEDEAGNASKVLRVTDHKTGKYRAADRMVIGGGRALQPVLYSMALEAALERRVVEGRLYYATTDGGFRDARIPINDASRRAGLEALAIIDRAVENAFLAPSPDDGACTWCDFKPVCGATAEYRSRRKAADLQADLLALRKMP